MEFFEMLNKAELVFEGPKTKPTSQPSVMSQLHYKIVSFRGKFSIFRHFP